MGAIFDLMLFLWHIILMVTSTTHRFQNEIVPVGKVLDPSDAVRLGNTILGFHNQRWGTEDSTYFVLDAFHPQASELETSELWKDCRFFTGIEDQKLIDQSTVELNECVDQCITTGKVSVDFPVGTPGDEWHIDGRDARLLVNLSEATLKLLVAVEWSDQDFEEGSYGAWSYEKLEGPEKYKPMEYAPGDGIYFNNLNNDPKCRVPHLGLYAPRKVFMRLFTHISELN